MRCPYSTSKPGMQNGVAFSRMHKSPPPALPTHSLEHSVLPQYALHRSLLHLPSAYLACSMAFSRLH